MKKNDFAKRYVSVLKENNISVSKDNAVKCMDKLIDLVSDVLLEGENISFSGFGKFECKLKEAHKTRNPRTGEFVDLPDQYVPKFKFSNEFKNKVKSIEVK